MGAGVTKTHAYYCNTGSRVVTIIFHVHPMNENTLPKIYRTFDREIWPVTGRLSCKFR